MVKRSVPMGNAKGSTLEGCVRSTFKATRCKDLQLHHLPSVSNSMIWIVVYVPSCIIAYSWRLQHTEDISWVILFLLQDILRAIMSRLTLKEAVRTSILSKKSKQLWKCYPKLVFTRATMRSCNAIIGHQKPMRTRFIRAINSVLRQLKSADLCKFVVKFGLRERHRHHINRWVKFSAASRTKHVVFDFCPGPKGSTDTDDWYSFPLDMFNGSGGSYVKHLRLGFVSLTLPSDFSGFKHLKKLYLHKVIITGELQCLLPECPVLEWLSIIFCKLSGLSISQQLSRLRFLCVKFCKLQELNIHAPNLTAFEFANEMIPIVLGESLNISEATIVLLSCSDCFGYVFSRLFNAFSHVQSISINFRVETEVCSSNSESCICGLDFHFFFVYDVVSYVYHVWCLRCRGLWKIPPGWSIWDKWYWRLIFLGGQNLVLEFFGWRTFWS